MKKLFITALLLSNTVFASSCEIKLIPKMNAILVLANYKTQWEVVVGTASYSDCLNAAEEKLAKVNAPKKLDTFEEVMDDYWSSWSNPAYFKGVKVKYNDDRGNRETMLTP